MQICVTALKHLFTDNILFRSILCFSHCKYSNLETLIKDIVFYGSRGARWHIKSSPPHVPFARAGTFLYSIQKPYWNDYINTLSLKLWGNDRAIWDFFSHNPCSHNHHPKWVLKGMRWGLLTSVFSPGIFLKSVIHCKQGSFSIMWYE